ncbi:MAG: hypothetical protein ACLSHO_01900 [Dysosmobacter sp.]
MEMNYTSAQANKLLKKLNDEYTALLDKETRSRDFRAAMGEDVESVRPVYDYAETQIRLAELEAKIRKLKHAINIFNATQTVDSFDMTIDELLVYIHSAHQAEKQAAGNEKADCPRSVWRSSTAASPASSTTPTPTMTSRRWRPTMRKLPMNCPVPSLRWTR